MNDRHQPITDPIIGLARRIARRADELSRETGADRTDFQPWIRAEEEILGIRLPEPSRPGSDFPATQSLEALEAG
jgi:hypothetical protein